MAVFDGWSDEEIITPTLDYYSLFERGMGPSEALRRAVSSGKESGGELEIVIKLCAGRRSFGPRNDVSTTCVSRWVQGSTRALRV